MAKQIFMINYNNKNICVQMNGHDKKSYTSLCNYGDLSTHSTWLYKQKSGAIPRKEKCAYLHHTVTL